MERHSREGRDPQEIEPPDCFIFLTLSGMIDFILAGCYCSLYGIRKYC
jgi:hypothetical protein